MSAATPRVTVDRIELSLEGFALDDAQFVAGRLQAAIAARLGGGGGEIEPIRADMPTPSRRRLCIDAIAARIADAIGEELGDAEWK
jgi:hypothetical protein